MRPLDGDDDGEGMLCVPGEFGWYDVCEYA
jgi:hypothetical protein